MDKTINEEVADYLRELSAGVRAGKVLGFTIEWSRVEMKGKVKLAAPLERVTLDLKVGNGSEPGD